MAFQRVKTGINGLDEITNGGFLQGRNILVSGACGSGKTILAMQFLYNGALQQSEPGVFVTFDEMPGKLRQDMLSFGWDLTALEKNKQLAIIDGASSRVGTTSEEEHSTTTHLDIDSMISDVLRTARKINAKRVAIDSLPAMFNGEKQSEVRRAVLKMCYAFAKNGLTTVMTSEIPEQSTGLGLPQQFSAFQTEDFVADGVIVLNFLGNNSPRTIHIRKLRGSQHSIEVHPIEITDQGIIVKKVNEVMR